VPHTLVFTGQRWHARAWCEKNQGYRDFVLSRFRGTPEILEESPHSGGDDSAWNTRVTIRIIADPRLRPEQQEVVRRDYGMCDGALLITIRCTLVSYALKLLGIDAGAPVAEPEARQIMVANLDELRPWLFD
ncbi:MAG: WYL domain-containing protein, partial [Parahaliea sp.]